MSQQGQGDVAARLRSWGDQRLDTQHDPERTQWLFDAAAEIDRLRTLLSSSRGEQGWRTPDDLPELKDGDRFAVYLAFDTGEVKLADWVAWTETASEYHASTGVYLGQSPQDGDALYMTDDGFDVRKDDHGRWVSHKHHDDGTKTPFYVTAWTEALKPLPSAPGSVQTSAAQGWREALLSSSRGEQAWIPIDHAPKSRPIIGKTAAGRIVKAKWVRLDDDTAGWGTPEEDDPRPNCWDDGFCWASNSDEMPSDPLVAYIEMPGSVPTSLAGQVPDGYVLVPKELSCEIGDAMIEAMWPSGEVVIDEAFDGPEQQLAAGWAAAISAAARRQE